MSGIHLGGASSTTYTPTELFAGEKEIVTKAMTVKTTLTLAAFSVLALDSNDELIEWVPGALDTTGVVIGVACEAIDTTGGAASYPVYISGYFNTDAINWPSGITDTQKFNAFNGTELAHRALGYSG